MVENSIPHKRRVQTPFLSGRLAFRVVWCEPDERSPKRNAGAEIAPSNEL
jgi:hypothetical protein